MGADEGSEGGRVEEQESFVASIPVESMTDFSKPINIAIESMPGSGEVCCVTHFCYGAAQRAQFACSVLVLSSSSIWLFWFYDFLLILDWAPAIGLYCIVPVTAQSMFLNMLPACR